MSESYVRFPPGRGHILIPLAPTGAARAGLSLYAPCRPLTVLAHQLVWRAAAAPGALRVFRPAGRWRPPTWPEHWSALCATWRGRLGRFDRLALYHRQRSRSGFAALLISGDRPVAFVKARRDGARPLTVEHESLRAFTARPPELFRVPEPLDRGCDAGWHWLAMTPLPPRPHLPALRPPLEALVAEIGAGLRLGAADPAPPAHWRAMHGDLTVYNLRRAGRARPVLVDWEDAGWGPPGADEVYYLATRAALGWGAPLRSPHAEAVRYWLARVLRQPADAGERPFRSALAAALTSMDPGVSC